MPLHTKHFCFHVTLISVTELLLLPLLLLAEVISSLPLILPANKADRKLLPDAFLLFKLIREREKKKQEGTNPLPRFRWPRFHYSALRCDTHSNREKYSAKGKQQMRDNVKVQWDVKFHSATAHHGCYGSEITFSSNSS